MSRWPDPASVREDGRPLVLADACRFEPRSPDGPATQDVSERVVSAGTPLLTLGELDRLEVVIELLSSEAVKVKAGMPVLVEGWGGDKALRAKVRLVEPFAATEVSALGIEEKRTNVIADFVDRQGR